MDDLNKDRESQKILEAKQVSVLLDYIKKKREVFEYSDTAMWIAQDTNSEDLILVSTALSDWMSKAKVGDPRKKELEKLLMCVFRVTAYCQNLETVSKASVSKFISIDKRNTQLASDIRSVELKSQQEIAKLKNEIETLKRENKALTNGEI